MFSYSPHQLTDSDLHTLLFASCASSLRLSARRKTDASLHEVVTAVRPWVVPGPSAR